MIMLVILLKQTFKYLNRGLFGTVGSAWTAKFQVVEESTKKSSVNYWVKVALYKFPEHALGKIWNENNNFVCKFKTLNISGV